MQKTSFLLLIMCMLFSFTTNGQNLQLKIMSKDSTEPHILDSIPYKKNFITEKLLTTEIDSVFNLTLQKGFINSKIILTHKINDSTTEAVFNLGYPYKNISITYTPEAASFLRQSFPENPIKIPIHKTTTTLNQITNVLSKQGFPFARVTLKNHTLLKDTIKASLVIDLNSSKRKIDSFVVKGYEKFPESYLKYFIKLKKGDVFDLNTINNKTRLINGLLFVNELKPPEVLFTNNSTTLYLYIEKVKSNSFDGFLGFGNSAKSNSFLFNGYLDLTLSNNLNYGESLKLKYKSDENEQRTFNIHTELPYLFKSPLGLELGLQIFKKDSSYTTVNQVAKVFYTINHQQKIAGGITFTESNNLLNTSSTDITDYKTRLYNISYEYKNNNTIPIYRNKTYLSADLGIGNRSISSKKTVQTQTNLDFYNLFFLNTQNSIFIRLKGSGVFSNNYLENEMALFGGINSIRGFDENSLISSWYTLTNTEYRYILNTNLYIHSIIDFAYLENKLSLQKEKLYSIGLGLGANTQAGLFKISYALGKNENETFKFKNAKIHLSLTTSF